VFLSERGRISAHGRCRIRRSICLLGLSATYRPGKKTIFKAIDEGINYFFGFGLDTQLTAVMRDVLKRDRSSFVLAGGVYNLIIGYPNIRKTLEKRLRMFRTDYLDMFLFLGVTREQDFPPEARDELYTLRDEGKIRAVGISTHDRKFAGKLAAENALDVLMIRYNAAHRGAEQDIFPYVKPHNPGIISFTATRWRHLLRRPRGWPRTEPVPSPGMAYRFVLSNSNVNVCLMAPSNIKQFENNMREIRLGPLSGDELDYMRRFGDVAHRRKRWFM
jgi:aryl-alcohol dehydrogenase-like predicted oxidoreductase